MTMLVSTKIGEDDDRPYSEPPSLILDIQFRDRDPGVRVPARHGGPLPFQLCIEINEWTEAPGHCFALTPRPTSAAHESSSGAD